MIKLVKYEDLTLFKNDVIPFLEKNEAENNLALGVLQSLSENPILMAAVVKEDHIGLVFLQTLPSQIIVSKPVPFTSNEIQMIGEQLTNTVHAIPGLVGEKELTTALASYIAEIKRQRTHVQMDQLVYKLENVKKPASTNGKLRKAEEKDQDTIKDWVYQFCVEVGQPISLEEAAKKTDEIMNRGNLVVWEKDGTLVSMANGTRPTKTNMTVSFVYTPIHERKKGYASDCVAAFTQLLLDQGYHTTSLYTDSSNPTSNKIYMEIGYEPIMDSIHINLK